MGAAKALDLSWATKDLSRIETWARLVNEHRLVSVAEVGVHRGLFAEAILDACPDVARYYLIDPWRELADWNKPLNKSDAESKLYYKEALRRTSAHRKRRVVLRGTTAEVAEKIDDSSLDLAYLDGDHSLRGITIDLMHMWSKVRAGGFLGGDDFNRRLWQHGRAYEPTLTFPYAIYFAEAVDAPIYALRHRQFLIHKVPGHRFVDMTGKFRNTSMRTAMRRRSRQPSDVSS